MTRSYTEDDVIRAANKTIKRIQDAANPLNITRQELAWVSFALGMFHGTLIRQSEESNERSSTTATAQGE